MMCVCVCVCVCVQMLWVESCTNPLLRITDIQALVRLVKSKNKVYIKRDNYNYIIIVF